MRKLPAFTIVECIAALLITAVTLVLAGWGMTALSASERHSLDHPIDWYVFLKEMEADNHHFVLKRVSGREVQVYSPRTDLNYTLQGRNVLYLTASARGGYLPLLDGIQGKAYHFTRLPGQRVLVEVTRENGEKLVGIMQFYQE